MVVLISNVGDENYFYYESNGEIKLIFEKGLEKICLLQCYSRESAVNEPKGFTVFYPVLYPESSFSLSSQGEFFQLPCLH